MDLSEITIKDIALLLKITEENLAKLSEKAPHMYYTREMRKRNGGIRIIEAPHTSLNKIQKILLDQLFSGLSYDPILFGGKGSSTKKAVRRHTRKALVITLDIKDFFPNVKSHKVKKMFIRRGAKHDVADLLTRLVTYKNHLPQGAPTSPCIARLILNPVAIHIKRVVRSVKARIEPSIWVDDIIISGPKGLKRLKKTLISIFNRYDFQIPEEKFKIMPDNQEQVSLGIRLNDGIGVPSSYLQKYKAECKKLGASSKRCQGMKAHIRNLQN